MPLPLDYSQTRTFQTRLLIASLAPAGLLFNAMIQIGGAFWMAMQLRSMGFGIWSQAGTLVTLVIDGCLLLAFGSFLLTNVHAFKRLSAPSSSSRVFRFAAGLCGGPMFNALNSAGSEIA